MPAFEFAIDLTVPDNTAFTVLTALRSMGYDRLTRVERTSLLRLDVGSGAMSAEECGRALTHAEIVFNPNKHRMTLSSDGLAGGHEAVVADKDDDTESLQELLTQRFGIRGLERVERATSWRLFEGDEAASGERLVWACERLLANPFSQTHVVRRRPSYAAVDGK
jgi:phosphoribosylformylglycinamidine (FGAM) synthase PurS component